ncbi:hypothetical protein CY35_13G073600 [Sphagnum magellanicum]|nr:hypothetical protein CY35_13G073600 [Sphagnum magellanicum]
MSKPRFRFRSATTRVRTRVAEQLPDNSNNNAEPVPLAQQLQVLMDVGMEHSSVQSIEHVQACHRHDGGGNSSMVQQLQELLKQEQESISWPPRCHHQPDVEARQREVNQDDTPLPSVDIEGARDIHSEALNTCDQALIGNSRMPSSMAQRLQLLVDEDVAIGDFRQQRSLQHHKSKDHAAGKKQAEVLDTYDTSEGLANVHALLATGKSPIRKAHALPSITEQFQEALEAAPESISSFVPSIHSSRDQASLYSSQLQKAPQNTGRHTEVSLNVTTPLPESSTETVQVIFNAVVAAKLELELGAIVRISPPWQELSPPGLALKIVLCTYFCEVVH